MICALHQVGWTAMGAQGLVQPTFLTLMRSDEFPDAHHFLLIPHFLKGPL